MRYVMVVMAFVLMLAVTTFGSGTSQAQSEGGYYALVASGPDGKEEWRVFDQPAGSSVYTITLDGCAKTYYIGEHGLEWTKRKLNSGHTFSVILKKNGNVSTVCPN